MNKPKVHKSLVTGSRVYGQPHGKSDIDLVLLTNDEMLVVLEQLGTKEDASQIDGHTSVRFGRLNVIATKYEKSFQLWHLGTAVLLQCAPVTRDEAIQFFHLLREDYRTNGAVVPSLQRAGQLCVQVLRDVRKHGPN